MDLNRVIITAHARAHAAELAVHANCRDAAIAELAKLRDMLNDQHELDAGGAAETAPPESPQ